MSLSRATTEFPAVLSNPIATISPHVSAAAYDVFGDGKLAVRGGYGLYYAYPGAQMRIWTCTEGFMVPQNQGAEAILTDPWGTSVNPVFTKPPTPYPSDVNEFPTISATNLMGNLQRNALIGPSSWYSDLGVAKDFRIDEEKRVQFRLEVYNWLNRPNMGSPNAQMNSADFGKILTLSGNRTMQYGLKFYF